MVNFDGKNTFFRLFYDVVTIDADTSRSTHPPLQRDSRRVLREGDGEKWMIPSEQGRRKRRGPSAWLLWHGIWSLLALAGFLAHCLDCFLVSGAGKETVFNVTLAFLK
jgi:hypothetical protein